MGTAFAKAGALVLANRALALRMAAMLGSWFWKMP
jgi:hypothetical protein